MDLKWLRRLEAFEMTGEIGLRYMLILLIMLGLLISVNVIITGQQLATGSWEVYSKACSTLWLWWRC